MIHKNLNIALFSFAALFILSMIYLVFAFIFNIWPFNNEDFSQVEEGTMWCNDRCKIALNWLKSDDGMKWLISELNLKQGEDTYKYANIVISLINSAISSKDLKPKQADILIGLAKKAAVARCTVKFAPDRCITAYKGI